MNSLTDQQLLREYTEHRSEAAFAELVGRHVDFVYSAALRMVRDAHLAEDVTQGVFVALAQGAPQLTGRPVLSGWLHRTAQNLAANAVRSDVRRRAREQAAAAMNEVNEPHVVWQQIAPHLDNALGELSESDRDAVLLRYFEGKSARDMAQTLGTSEDAAQKRVSRAVERLRELFAKRGVSIGASALVAGISANSVQAGPVALSATILTAAMVSGAAVQSAAVIGTAKTATLLPVIQKALIVAAIAAGVGTGVYETRLVLRLRNQSQTLQQQQDALANQLMQLSRGRDEAAGRLAAASKRREQLRLDAAEISRLRSQAARLQADSQELAGLKEAAARKDAAEAARRAQNPRFSYTFASAYPPPAKSGEIPPKPDYLLPVSDVAMAKTNRLTQWLEQIPGMKIPELKWLDDETWLWIAKTADLETELGVRRALANLRDSAKLGFGQQLSAALRKFIVANNGDLPASVSDLKPYFSKPLDEALFDRYKILYSGKLADVPEGEWKRMAIETVPSVDGDDARQLQIGLDRADLVPRK